MVLETKEGESWNKGGTQPCLVVRGEVRVIHSFILQRFTEQLRYDWHHSRY